MRTAGLLLIVGSLALAFAAGDASAQRRGGGDPGQMFDGMANGKTEINIADAPNPRAKSFLEQIAQGAGVTNGKLTKDQFVKGMEAFRARMMGGRPGPAPAASGGTPAAAGDAGAGDAAAEAEFKRRDRNDDGFLNADEMNKSLRNELDKWDVNKDGRIDLKEYKAYYKARMEARQGGSGGVIIVTAPVEEEEKKPTVYRAGKLPKGIPDWFEKIDTDNDGQIGLYEWLKAGRDVEDFKAIDRNQDGFLTIQEVMRAEKNKPKNKKNLLTKK